MRLPGHRLRCWVPASPTWIPTKTGFDAVELVGVCPDRRQHLERTVGPQQDPIAGSQSTRLVEQSV